MRSLSDQCVILNKAIRYSVYVPLDSFIDKHLVINRLTEADHQDLISHVIRKLQQSKILRKRRWALRRTDGSGTEDSQFAHLQSTANTVHDLCVEWDVGKGKLGAATTRMVYNPAQSLKSAFLEKPDIKTNAQFVLVTSPTGEAGEGAADASIADIASVGLFRKSSYSSILEEVEVDIVAAASHILYCDPARRFMTVFTIMGRRMTFWHFSRSHIAITYFDYHTNPEYFVRFLIFMMFASREELGYDSTVTRVLDAEGKTQYQFQISAKIYQTLRSLAEPRSLDVVIKAPRVWAVMELHAEDMTPTGETMVLKDFWPDADDKGELEIQTEIFDALRELDKVGVAADERPPGETGVLAEDAKKYFLKIAADVAVEINGVPESDFCVMRYSASYGRAQDYLYRPPLPLQAKTHRRVVFEEECQDFDQLSRYADIALGMAQLVRGLEYMRLAGWLHHDVSLGNCLFFVSQRQLKISDLECARRYDAPYTEEGVTGTPGFMAVEYEQGKHYFDNTKENPSREPFFRYNFAHDLEAALWIYVWFAYNTLPDCVDGAATARIRGNVWWYRDLLARGGTPERRGFVTDAASWKGDAARKALAELYEQVPEGAVLVAGLSCFDVLKRMYQDIEATEPLDSGVEGMTRWDPKFFERRYYQCLYEGFMDMHERLAGVKYSAILHWDFENAAAERLREGGGKEDQVEKGQVEEDEKEEDKLEDAEMEDNEDEDEDVDDPSRDHHESGECGEYS